VWSSRFELIWKEDILAMLPHPIRSCDEYRYAIRKFRRLTACISTWGGGINAADRDKLSAGWPMKFFRAFPNTALPADHVSH